LQQKITKVLASFASKIKQLNHKNTSDFMPSYLISELYIYPIKSLGGISVSEAYVEKRGFQYDRRMMLVNSENEFLTQRQNAEMALLKVKILENSLENGLEISHKTKKISPLFIPFDTKPLQNIKVSVWDDICEAQTISQDANKWFSEALAMDCRLVYMPNNSERLVDTKYAKNQEITSFTDGYPFLIIGQSSLDELNSRLEKPVEMLRFRPNIVFLNGKPFEEDDWESFLLANLTFKVAKPCARCVVTTINPETAEKGKEPLKTLAKYRNFNGKIYFGQNLVHFPETGNIKIGDEIQPTFKKE
jgi:uncharacterized protein